MGFRERANERLDHVCLMRDKCFAYYKNYIPFAPAGQHLAYLWEAPATPAWEKHHRVGKTDEVTGRFFRSRVSEEFYDNESDFDSVKNLFKDPKHQVRISELKAALCKKQLELFDSGLLPEGMRMMAAWSLVKLGDSTDAIACLNDFLFKSTTNEMMLHNMLD